MHDLSQNTGWARNISIKLEEYELETDWENIKKKSLNEWKETVRKAVLKANGKKLLEKCVTVNERGEKILTKTKHIYDKLKNEIYTGKPIKFLVDGNKQRSRTIFLAQNHMLECGKNMKGTMNGQCTVCNEIDDEQHRLVACKKWSDLRTNDETRVQDIYSKDIDVLNHLLKDIDTLWDTKFTNGRMKK